ncbi:MAG: chemotaxis protein CheW [Gemmatimonadota bacterium]
MAEPAGRIRDAAFWSDVRAKLDLLAETPARSPDSARRVLEARAHELARTPAADTAEHIEVVRFSRGGETFLVETRSVIAVTYMARVARLPGSHPPARGLGVFRGDLLIVADLRIDGEWTNGARKVLVLGRDEPVVGLVADSIAGLERLPTATLHAPAQDGSSLVRAVVDGPASLLDTDLLLRNFSGSRQ